MQVEARWLAAADAVGAEERTDLWVAEILLAAIWLARALRRSALSPVGMVAVLE
jgi:ABC-type proline/glycine betaine transport system permease subunit